MTARWPNGYLHRASSKTLLYRKHAFTKLTNAGTSPRARFYAQDQRFQGKADGIASTPADPVKAALTIVESRAKLDPINPPRSTLPPPLSLPTRGDESAPIYWFRIGRAYGTFYKDGIKAVWFNYKASKILKERITNERLGEGKGKDITDAVQQKVITRSEFQLLARNSRDIGKLPLFSLLVLVFGEWLVLIVPFIPNAVPGTCRIPKQIQGMRLAAEERRRISFRQGISEPSSDQIAIADQGHGGEEGRGRAWPIAFNTSYRTNTLANLRDDQLHHLSTTLGLHSRLWDRLQLPPPAFLLRSRIKRRLQYISQDDSLLLADKVDSRDSGDKGMAARLSPDELYAACEERGLDILGKKDEVLRQDLSWWLKRQQEDGGQGKALFAMLFRRPNAWRVEAVTGRKKKGD